MNHGAVVPHLDHAQSHGGRSEGMTQVKLSRGTKNTIANLFGLNPARRMTPDQAIPRINLAITSGHFCSEPIGAGKDDFPN